MSSGGAMPISGGPERVPTGSVTIVVPTYKRPLKLKRAVLSILAQSYQDVRVFVSDNASNDGTREMVSDLMVGDPRVEYHCHNENVGLIDNFNFAFAQVKTPFFGILTDDDYLLPGFLDTAMRSFQRHPEIKVSIQSAPLVEVDGTFIHDALARWPREGVYAPGECIRLVIEGSHPVLTMCVFRYELRDELHFDKQADSISDLPLLISILAKYPFHVSKEIGGYFIRHDEASGRNFSRIENVRAICPAYIRVEELLREAIPADSAVKSLVVGHMKLRVDRIFFSLMLENLMMKNVECSDFLAGVMREREPSTWQRGTLMLAWLAGRLSTRLLSLCLRGAAAIKRGIRRMVSGNTGVGRRTPDKARGSPPA